MFMDYHFLFEIAVILLSTKVLGILTKRFALPQVVGALLAGLLLGPAMLGVLQETTLMDQLAELGVIVLMFNAGLETDLRAQAVGKGGLCHRPHRRAGPSGGRLCPGCRL